MCDWLIGHILDTNDDVHTIFQICLANNTATDIKYFSEIIVVLDKIIHKIDTYMGSLGGGIAYTTNKKLYTDLLIV